MKLSTLTLSVLSAILLSACGGSSSNDNAPVDKGQPSEMKPTNKTPVEENTNQEAQKPSSTEKKTTNNTDDAGSTPIVKNPPKNTPIVIQPTLTKEEKIKKEKKEIEQSITKLNTKIDDANKVLDKQDRLDDLKEKLDKIPKNNNTSRTRELIEKEIDKLQQELPKKTEEVNEINKKLLEDSVQLDQKKADLAAKEVELLAAQEKDTVAAEKEQEVKQLDANISAADLKNRNAQELLIKSNAEIVNIERELNNKNIPKEEKEQLKKKKEELEKNHDELKKAADNAQNELKNSEQKADDNTFLNIVNGVRFSDARNSTFGEIKSARPINDPKSWQIIFTGAKGEKPVPTMIDTKVAVNQKVYASSYGSFETLPAFQKDPAVDYAIQNNDNSSFGYVGDKFYSVGFLASQVSREDLNQLKTAKYSGTAFVTVTDKNNKPSKQVADFSADANFADKTPSLNGKFANFKLYTDGKSFESLKNTKATNMQAVEFKSTINKDNYSFHSAPDAETQVSGFFYGENAAEVGGLVKSDKLHLQGAFGGKKEK